MDVYKFANMPGLTGMLFAGDYMVVLREPSGGEQPSARTLPQQQVIYNSE